MIKELVDFFNNLNGKTLTPEELEQLDNSTGGNVAKQMIEEFRSQWGFETKAMLNLYCNGEVDRVKIYAVLLGIIDEKFKKFYKVMVNKNGDVSYYLCY